MFETIVTTLQIACVLILAVGLPLYAVLKLKWRAEAAEMAARNADLRNASLTAELEVVTAILPQLERDRLKELRETAGPLDHPPAGVAAVWAYAEDAFPPDPYFAPFGWEQIAGSASLVGASLHGDSPMSIGHGLVTSKSGFGKDMLVSLLIWFLCKRNTPRTFQFVWIDGTMSDGAFFTGVAHTWVPPVLGADAIPLIMQALRLERSRRDKLRVEHSVDKWENLPEGVRPPLLLVYVSELDVLELGTAGEEGLEDWLKVELTSARKAGIRYLIGSQTVANRKTRWRDQITWYCAGHQDVERAILPNVGMSSQELKELGGMSPLDFAAPGYFTIRIGRNVATVRTPQIDLAERRRMIGELPVASYTLTVVERLAKLTGLREPGLRVEDGGLSAEELRQLTTPTVTTPGAVSVSEQERREIIAAAQRLPSRRQVCLELYRTTGGKGYDKVKLVLDAEGLLVSDQEEITLKRLVPVEE